MSKISVKLKRELFTRYYSKLNEKQREAVFAKDGPVLVIAGAGSGKTTVLVNRISYLIHYGNAYHSSKTVDANLEELVMLEHMAKDDFVYPREAYPPVLAAFAVNPCPPDRILAITFTNKAAGEMKERLQREIGDGAQSIWAGTFHSICVRLLKMFAEHTPYGKEFTIYDQDDTKKVVNSIIKEMEIENEEITAKYVINVISKAKNAMQSSDTFEKNNQSSEKRRVCATIYHSYQKQLRNANAMDFDDLILETVKLLQENETVLSWCQNKFRYVLVDEYQDTNYAQYLLMKLIGAGHGNIMVVGDDDQSIYKFRGATVENILHFDKQFADTNIIMLEQNYRSTRNIIDAANALISNNDSRRGKTLWSDNDVGRKVTVHQLENAEKEALFIAEHIEKTVMLQRRRYRDFAVLYRTKAQSNILETIFAKSGLPHRLLSGVRFYDHTEVKDILAYLRFIHNPNDFVSLSRIINIPRRGIGQATIDKIKQISQQTERSYFEVISHSAEYEELKRSSAKLLDFSLLISDLMTFAMENSPSATIHRVIDKTGYMQTLLGEENDERRKNVDELLTSAAMYEEKNEDRTLSGFLEEIALVSDVDNYDGNSNAVVLMTVHAAKGLEFPIVYLAGMEENLFPSPQSCQVQSDLEEERRLAYVAMTRAMNELYVTCCHHRMIYGKTNQNDVSRFIREIPENLLNCHWYQPDYREKTLAERYGFSRPQIYSVSTFDKRPEAPTVSTVKQTQKKSEPIERFAKGDKVSHALFGVGTIMDAKPYGSDTLYQIDFDNVGVKKLMGTYAKLKRTQ